MRSISYFAFVINVEESLGIPAQFEFMSKVEKKKSFTFYLKKCHGISSKTVTLSHQ